MAVDVRERVAEYRRSRRSEGLRLIQIWVPDTRAAAFATECRRQSALIAGDASERAATNWVEAAADVEGWE